MVRILLSLLLVFFGISYQAQSISKSVIASTGGTLINQQNDLVLSYTVGEVVIGSMGQEGIQIGNGYYSSFDSTFLDVVEIAPDVQFSVFPNPVIDFVKFEIKNSNETYHLEIHDIEGRVYYNSPFQSKSIVNLSLLPSGVYIVRVSNTTNNVNSTLKVVKL